MNEKKICFIMCTNNEQYESEAIFYINNLIVPEGYEIDVLSVKDAACMTAGYNEGMQATDAKYKVYLHQDVFIIEPHFIEKILKIFEDSSVGMIGMVGAPVMPENGIMWYTTRVGEIYSSNVSGTGIFDYGKADKPYTEVEAIDGLMMITQYDVKWRDDIFDKWDFYDVSQSFEFRRAGYKVVVPYIEKPWCIHDDGMVNLRYYYEEREKLLKEYYS